MPFCVYPLQLDLVLVLQFLCPVDITFILSYAVSSTVYKNVKTQNRLNLGII